MRGEMLEGLHLFPEGNTGKIERLVDCTLAY